MTVQCDTGCCDLHTHTTASDGSDTARELVKLAADAGLRAIGVTDHDTVAGLKDAWQAGIEYGVEIIKGVELSVLHPCGNMHLLGYFVDEESPQLKEVLKRVQEARSRRNPKILEKLKGLGMEIDIDELEEMAQGGQIGRPHIARAMVKHGYVKSISDAFSYYLKNGGPAYVPKSILTPEDAIEAVHLSGALAVLAHPFSLNFRTGKQLEKWVAEWKEMGLDGIECYYSEHGKDLTELCLGLCKKYDLVVTGGSDYHGKAKPHIRLGKGRGNLCVPYKCVEELRKRYESRS